MTKRIDEDRGVYIRVHQASGMDVYMYVDQPGVYYNVHGLEVGDKIAAEAGYNVEKYAKDRLKQERFAAAREAIETELASFDETERKVVKETAGFKIVSVGLGGHHLEDPDGNVLTTVPMPMEQAKILLEQLVKVDKKREAQGQKAK